MTSVCIDNDKISDDKNKVPKANAIKIDKVNALDFGEIKSCNVQPKISDMQNQTGTESRSWEASSEYHIPVIMPIETSLWLSPSSSLLAIIPNASVVTLLGWLIVQLFAEIKDYTLYPGYVSTEGILLCIYIVVVFGTAVYNSLEIILKEMEEEQNDSDNDAVDIDSGDSAKPDVEQSTSPHISTTITNEGESSVVKTKNPILIAALLLGLIFVATLSANVFFDKVHKCKTRLSYSDFVFLADDYVQLQMDTSSTTLPFISDQEKVTSSDNAAALEFNNINKELNEMQQEIDDLHDQISRLVFLLADRTSELQQCFLKENLTQRKKSDTNKFGDKSKSYLKWS